MNSFFVSCWLLIYCLHHRNCQDHELFVSTTKVFLNVLHHCSTAVLRSMSEPETDTTVETHSNDLCSMDWPDSSDSIGHTHWMRQRLQTVVTICDKILKDGKMSNYCICN